MKFAGAALAIARETLVHRRAVLADAQGDSADAEAFYRELAILNPRHGEARRALAEIALNRGDYGAAAVRLEEVLRLLPARTRMTGERGLFRTIRQAA